MGASPSNYWKLVEKLDLLEQVIESQQEMISELRRELEDSEVRVVRAAAIYA